FMAIVSIIMEAVKRHSKLLRAAIASPGNDHRLGANEAPPSIISIFLGDTLTEVFESIRSGATFEPNGKNYLDIGAEQLAQLLQDNTDRNRTSPFAFTGNKFEFRAVGSSAPIGLPLSVLNAAVADVFTESNTYLKQLIDSGKSVSTALTELTKKWIESSWDVVFNGDGYSDEWVKEAERRGLPNLKTTPDVLDVFKDESLNNFLVSQGVFKPAELTARYNVLVERYIKIRDIEFGTLRRLVYQNVLPDAFKYKEKLVSLVSKLKENKLDASVELGYLELLTDRVKDVNEMTTKLHQLRIETDRLEEKEQSFKIAYELLPLAEDIAKACSRLETIVPDDLWSLPKTYEMLFVR
ncbi:MAG: glutamine synthetase type III, partial [Bdellovibrionales bacterium]|nr:glutamine synthetase type III [Bdellovibrionales bacterium]